VVPRFQSQEFLPHLTVATIRAGIEEKVIKEAKIELEKERKIEILVEEIRLTQIIQKPDGQIIYRTKYRLPLE
jgi:2'-5' RNA ligase